MSTNPSATLKLSRVSTGVIVSVGVFIVLYAMMVAASPVAGTPVLVSSFITLVAPLALAAAGTTLVLIVGGFDLSVAGTISLSNVIAATAMEGRGSSVWLIALAVLALGAVIGVINGVLVAVVGLPSLGVTLGTNIVLAGAALMLLPAPGGTVPAQFTNTLTASAGYLPVAGVVLVIVGALWVLYARTRIGMATFAVGGDITSAALSGIPVIRVRVTAFAIAGVLYAGSGLYFSAITGTGSPSSGNSFLLTAFAAAALGLVSFTGGRGSLIAAMFGAAIITVIPKLLFAVGVADYWVGVVQGIVVFIALAIPLAGYAIRRRTKLRSGSHENPDPTSTSDSARTTTNGSLVTSSTKDVPA